MKKNYKKQKNKNGYAHHMPGKKPQSVLRDSSPADSNITIHTTVLWTLYTGWAKKMTQLWLVILLQPFKIK